MTSTFTDNLSISSTVLLKIPQVTAIIDASDRTTPPILLMDKAKIDMSTKPSVTPKGTHDGSQQVFTTPRRK